MTLIVNGETREFDNSSTLQDIITNLQTKYGQLLLTWILLKRGLEVILFQRRW